MIRSISGRLSLFLFILTPEKRSYFSLDDMDVFEQVKVRNTTLWVRTDINGNAHKMFSAIGLKPPDFY